jgi:hypothetical protein
MMAKKKQIEERETTLTEPTVQVIEMLKPPPRPEGRIVGEGVDAVAELTGLLKDEAKIL